MEQSSTALQFQSQVDDGRPAFEFPASKFGQEYTQGIFARLREPSRKLQRRFNGKSAQEEKFVAHLGRILGRVQIGISGRKSVRGISHHVRFKLRAYKDDGMKGRVGKSLLDPKSGY